MQKIIDIRAREILDSRGNPTIETICELIGGISAKASVPSGASTGSHEALELRDKDEKRYAGKGVLSAVENVNMEIREALSDKEFDQGALDHALITLDGTPDKSKLGGNAILGASLAFARASALAEKKELYEHIGSIAGNVSFKLPIPMLNVINGGKHADSGLDIQEFMLIPTDFGSFKEKIRAGAETIYLLKEALKRSKYAVSVGDEGGFAPKLKDNEEAMKFLAEAIAEAGYSGNMKIGLDVAASSFFENGKYKPKTIKKDMMDWYAEMSSKYPIVSIEDGFAEDDWDNFMRMTEIFGMKMKIVGDDLTVTDPKRIKEAVEKKAANAVIIKPNQIGTLSETITAVKTAKDAGWAIVISHRSGETTDDFIADLAVGLSADYIKSGSLTRGERICKYNRLLEIEENMI